MGHFQGFRTIKVQFAFLMKATYFFRRPKTSWMFCFVKSHSLDGTLPFRGSHSPISSFRSPHAFPRNMSMVLVKQSTPPINITSTSTNTACSRKTSLQGWVSEPVVKFYKPSWMISHLCFTQHNTASHGGYGHLVR